MVGGMSDEFISIDRLVKHFGAVVALAGISMEVRRGEFLSLLGPSGCGKTTMLRAIAGFVEPTSGEVRIAGRLMNPVPPHRRPINTVFQNYALFPHMTVAENVAFGPRRAGVARAEIAARVTEVLGIVGMSGFDQRYPRALSGGQQQRVALARAIINRPQVLLLDEPLGALDLKLRKRMQVELKRLHEHLGLTFIYVTHDQEEALTMSDRIAVMNQGEIVQLGTGEEIYRAPVSRYVADFIGEANLIDCIADGEGTIRLGAGGPALPYRSDSAGPVTLMLRPEDIRIGAPAADEVALDATIRDKIFIGQSWRLFAVLRSGQEVTAQPGSDDNTRRIDRGATVTLSWAREHARVLSA
jgi:spermidine/putrescine transport system ATP-binding protein